MDWGHAIVVISRGAMRVDNDHFSNASLAALWALLGKKKKPKRTLLLVIALALK